MKRIGLYVLPLAILGLVGWTAAAATDDTGTSGKSETEIRTKEKVETDNGDREIERKKEVKIERKGESTGDLGPDRRIDREQSAGRDIDVRGRGSEAGVRAPAGPGPESKGPAQPMTDAPNLQDFRDMGPVIKGRSGMDRGEAMGPSPRGTTWGPPEDTRTRGSIYGYNDQGQEIRTAPRSGWEHEWSTDDGGLYGYSDTTPAEVDQGETKAGKHGKCEGKTEKTEHHHKGLSMGHLNTPWTAKGSDWTERTGTVDENFIQTEDDFDVDRDFYTKEWHVQSPAVELHPRFHTQYDNDMTRDYFTPWAGPAVTWAPNSMIKEPMPRPSAADRWNLSRKQQVTYFTSWKDGETTNTPGAFLAGRPVASTGGVAFRGGAGPGIYGYTGTDREVIRNESAVRRDGAVHLGGQMVYFDDLDLLTGPGAGDVYGFVSPEQDEIFVAPSPSAGELNATDSTLPANREGMTTGAAAPPAATSGGIYGYVGEGEGSEQVTVKQHKEARATVKHKNDGDDGGSAKTHRSWWHHHDNNED